MIKKVMLLALLLSFSLPSIISASPPDFVLNSGGEKQSVGDYFSGINDKLSGDMGIWSTIIPAIFTILFVIGIIRLGYAMMTKTGAVLKEATGTLIIIPTFFIIIRLFGIFILNENSMSNVNVYLNGLIDLVSGAVFYIAVGLVLIGLLLRLFHVFINHPEYGRWSNRLFVFALISVLLSVIVKPVLYSI